MRFLLSRSAPLTVAMLGLAASCAAKPAVPAYSSRVGAPYTVYLDFAGFDYTGTWLGKTPGSTPAYTTDGDATTFSGSELSNIQQIWARVAEKYTAFNVNVTTVDPAITAGQASSDLTRQTYYDNTPQLMHTTVGGDGTWIGGGGYSYIGTTQNAYPGTLNGAHSNWVFAAEAPSNLQFVAEASSHENGHGFGLNHQSDLTQAANTTQREYSFGDAAHGGQSSVAPIMGDSYSVTRGLWRTGTLDTGAIQNDVQTLLSNANMRTLMDDGIGHSLTTATSLVASKGILSTLTDQGFLTPADSLSPTALGQNSYTKDYFSFLTDGSAINLRLNAGAQRISAGFADPGVTFDGMLNILDANGVVVGTATRDAGTLFSTYTGSLAPGLYYAQVVDYGGYTSTHETGAMYYTMGSYFLSGSGGFQAVPEPSIWLALGVGFVALTRRRSQARRR